MTDSALTLQLLPTPISVCRLASQATISPWMIEGMLWSVTRTQDELSVICTTAQVPDDIQAEHGWRIWRVAGTLDFSLIGIIAKISAVLAKVEISIFVLSTYDTDYIMVKEAQLDDTKLALSNAGYQLVTD